MLQRGRAIAAAGECKSVASAMCSNLTVERRVMTSHDIARSMWGHGGSIDRMIKPRDQCVNLQTIGKRMQPPGPWPWHLSCCCLCYWAGGLPACSCQPRDEIRKHDKHEHSLCLKLCTVGRPAYLGLPPWQLSRQPGWRWLRSAKPEQLQGKGDGKSKRCCI